MSLDIIWVFKFNFNETIVRQVLEINEINEICKNPNDHNFFVFIDRKLKFSAKIY